MKADEAEYLQQINDKNEYWHAIDFQDLSYLLNDRQCTKLLTWLKRTQASVQYNLRCLFIITLALLLPSQIPHSRLVYTQHYTMVKHIDLSDQWLLHVNTLAATLANKQEQQWSTYHRFITNLEYFCSSTFKQFYVSWTDTLTVLGQCAGCNLIRWEQNKCITSCSSIGLVNKQDSIFSIENADRRWTLFKKLDLQQQRAQYCIEKLTDWAKYQGYGVLGNSHYIITLACSNNGNLHS